MPNLTINRAVARFWKKAIAVSDKLTAREWNAFLLFSILLFILSVALVHISIEANSENQSLDTALNAHNIQQRSCMAYSYRTASMRLIYYQDESHSLLQSVFEGRIFLSVNGSNLKRPAANPDQVSKQRDVWDGSALYRIRISTFGNASIAVSSVPLPLADNEKVVVVSIPAPAKEPVSQDKLPWFMAIVSALNLIWTAILTWISNNRARAEFILKTKEMEIKAAEAEARIKQAQLEILKLQQEIEKGQLTPLIILAESF